MQTIETKARIITEEEDFRKAKSLRIQILDDHGHVVGIYRGKKIDPGKKAAPKVKAKSKAGGD